MANPHGLKNYTGACCWWNSLLQALLSCRHFVKGIIEPEDHTPPSPIVQGFQRLIENPTTSYELLRLMPRSLLHGQQSPSEGLTYLLDNIKSEYINDLFNHHYLQTIKVKDTGEEISSQKESNNFFAEFNELELLTKGLLQSISRKTQTIPDYKYKNNQLCEQTWVLKKIPPIVVVLLNRYKANRSTINLPETFQIKHISKGAVTYKKVACIDHFGSLHGGHYIARCRRAQSIYLFNDEAVSPLNDLATNTNTYITFYESEVMV